MTCVRVRPCVCVSISGREGQRKASFSRLLRSTQTSLHHIAACLELVHVLHSEHKFQSNATKHSHAMSCNWLSIFFFFFFSKLLHQLVSGAEGHAPPDGRPACCKSPPSPGEKKVKNGWSAKPCVAEQHNGGVHEKCTNMRRPEEASGTEAHSCVPPPLSSR